MCRVVRKTQVGIPLGFVFLYLQYLSKAKSTIGLLWSSFCFEMRLKHLLVLLSGFVYIFLRVSSHEEFSQTLSKEVPAVLSWVRAPAPISGGEFQDTLICVFGHVAEDCKIYEAK